ncbi:PLD nuclease N-terminal domain-containing protein [Arthrobacter alpinus]|nr:PLD nuclease N-terminal domain-containing protein [Arthrobacter alpinus]
MRYIIPVTLGVVLFVYGLIDCIRSSEANDVRSIPKPAWILVIIFLNVIGVGLWFLFGRPQYARAAPGAASSFGSSTAGQRGPASGVSNVPPRPTTTPSSCATLQLTGPKSWKPKGSASSRPSWKPARPNFAKSTRTTRPRSSPLRASVVWRTDIQRLAKQALGTPAH